MFQRFTAALAGAAFAACCLAPAVAMDDAMMMKSGNGARFGGSVYTGAPALPSTLSLVVAGGGPGAFKTTTLVGVLAGPNANAEVTKLDKQFGNETVARFIKTFDFVIADSLRLVNLHHVALPSNPSPNPKDGKALAAALYTLGVDKTTNEYNVEYMLDHLVSHPIHVQVMKDIDAKFGAKADAEYHVGLLQIMKDLKGAYGL